MSRCSSVIRRMLQMLSDHLVCPLECERGCRVCFFRIVPFIRATPGDTPSHAPQECFSIRELQQFEIVSSLKSRPRTNSYLRTTGFSECPCFYLYLFTCNCLVRREEALWNARCQSTPPATSLFVCLMVRYSHEHKTVGWGNLIKQNWHQCYLWWWN